MSDAEGTQSRVIKTDDALEISTIVKNYLEIPLNFITLLLVVNNLCFGNPLLNQQLNKQIQ